MAGAEEGAAPLHLNTGRFYSGHTMTALSTRPSHFLFAQMCLDSQCMGDKNRVRSTVTNQ